MAEVSKLIDGYREFYRKYFASGDTLYQKLTNVGQSPKTLIIACSDSRVDPSIVTNATPGEIFVVRNVANLVPPCDIDSDTLHGVSAALEFAVRFLKVKHIVVLGHSGCAGIQALLDSSNIGPTDFIGKWMDAAKPAKEMALNNNPNAGKDMLQHQCEKENVLLSLNNLLTFPWVKSRVENGQLKLHGWHLHLENGTLQQYNPTSAAFENIDTQVTKTGTQ